MATVVLCDDAVLLQRNERDVPWGTERERGKEREGEGRRG